MLRFTLITKSLKKLNLRCIKFNWDTANEICTHFTAPWLLQLYKSASQRFSESQGQPSGIETVLTLLGDAAPPSASSGQALLPTSYALLPLLNAARAIEKAADARLQALQAEIDEAVYDLYAITPADRALIERELGNRPPEIVWPQMEGKSDKEKRCEHVRRLFSYYALQAARASDDGIVPLVGCAARAPYLVERIRALLEAEFGSQAAYQLEQDAAAYLGRPLEDWLHGAALRDFHVKLYKNRPILWRLASPKGYFAALVDYHRLTRDTLPKVRTHYLWPQMESARTRLAAAKAHGASPKAIGDLEDELADLAACDAALESVIQGAVEVTLPEWAAGPYRNGQAPYDPELDDGVAVNITPVQAAGLVGRVVK